MRVQIKLVFAVLSLLSIVTACGNKVISTPEQEQKQTVSDLRSKSVESITDDDLYPAMDLMKKQDRNEQDFKQAFHVLNELARRKNNSAEYALGIWYGDELNPERNIDQAISWYTKAAENGSQGAQNDLGFLLLGKEGFPKRIDQAEHWLIKAYDSDASNINSIRNLGTMYYKDFVPANLQKSLYWFDKAARLGDSVSYLNYIQILSKVDVARREGKVGLPAVDYKLGYYRACVLKRYQIENPVGWAALIKRQPNAEDILELAGAILARQLSPQEILRIEQEADSVDLSKEFRFN